jgi:ABC-type thiamin/hydroxymethylpyrimidine transport system permease subunit
MRRGSIVSSIRDVVFVGRLVIAIGILSIVFAVIFVWVNERGGLLPAMVAALLMAPVFGWCVGKVMGRRRL